MIKERAMVMPPFLDANVKRMLIGGKWVEAVLGETFDCINPANVHMPMKLKYLPECGRADHSAR